LEIEKKNYWGFFFPPTLFWLYPKSACISPQTFDFEDLGRREEKSSLMMSSLICIYLLSYEGLPKPQPICLSLVFVCFLGCSD
jgi:hypothetical protein